MNIVEKENNQFPSQTSEKKRKLHEATAHEWHLIWLEIMTDFKKSFKTEVREQGIIEGRKKFEERFKKALRWFRANGPKIEYGGMRYSTI